jgi:hypothetical protein
LDIYFFLISWKRDLQPVANGSDTAVAAGNADEPQVVCERNDAHFGPRGHPVSHFAQK